MKYTVEERLDIGRRVHERELSRRVAAMEYKLNESTIKDYLAMYRAANHLEPQRRTQGFPFKANVSLTPVRMEDYATMSKEELIQELLKSRIAEARLKKGYEVKGVGADKEYIRLDNKNTK